jgi:uncharacterized repeat protein (TIGR02543 family)
MMKKLYLSLVLLLMSLVTLSSIPLKAATPIGTTFEFSYETKMGDAAASVAATIPDKAYGSTVTIDGGSLAASGYTFVTYIVNGKVEYALPDQHTFTVTSDLDITAFYKPDGTVMVAFMDANQDMLKVEYITSGGNATPPSTSGLEKPGLEVSVSTPWSGSYTGVTQDTVLWVVYESAISETYTLTVNNGTGSGTYDYNEVATVTANGTGTFQYWFMNGNIVSLQPTYSFTVLDNNEINAVYTGEATGPNAETPFISLSEPYAIKTSYSTYVGQFYLPTGHEMVEFGLIASDTPGDITLDTLGVEKIRSDKYNADTGEFVRSLLDSTYQDKNIRAYMITSNGGVLTETYSFVNDNLFISEYGEGSGLNKWIEIYNPNDYDVDLSNYSLSLFTGEVLSPSNTEEFDNKVIGANDVYVIYNSGAGTEVSTRGDLTNNGVINFNGDDELALYKNGYIIDVIGEIGAAGDFAKDVTLTRDLAITSSSFVWNISDWTSLAQDTFTSVGFHNPVAPTSITISGDTSVMATSTINLSVIYPGNSIEGVTWESSNELVATVDSSGVVTGVAEGTVTITATSSAPDNSGVTDTHSVEVTAPVTYTVYFEENGGSTVADQTSILSGNTATEPADPTRTDYAFRGWFTDDTSFLNEFDFATAITSDITLYAKWLEEFVVTFDSNEGSAVSSQTVADGEKASQPTAPTKDGYAFDGWYTSLDGGTTLGDLWVFNSDIVDSDITLYAKWVLESSVTYSSDLFISEYIEGGSYNKSIEIFNNTGVGVDLSAYTIKLCVNGGTSCTTYSISETSLILNHGDVFVISHGSAIASILSVTDKIDGSICNFNGDDLVALYKGETLIDIIGVLGAADPGTSWDGITVNKTLVRKDTITDGNTTWTPAEWDVYPQDTTAYLGAHTVNPE